MERIGVRQLRQHASVWLRRVEAGESFEVTDRGRPVALLIPTLPRVGIQLLIESGRVTRPEGDLLDLGNPLPAQPGQTLPSQLLEKARGDER